MSTRTNGRKMHPKVMMPCSSLTIGQTGIEIPGGTLITQDSLTRPNGRRVYQRDTKHFKVEPRLTRNIDIIIRRVDKPKLPLRIGPKII